MKMSCASSSRVDAAGRLGEADLDHLPRVVPLVDRRRRCRGLRSTAGARAGAPSAAASTLAISVLPTPASPSRNSGRAQLQREKHRGREAAVGDVVLRRSSSASVASTAAGSAGWSHEMNRAAEVPPPESIASRRRQPAAATARDAITVTRCARYSGEPCRSVLRPLASTFTALRGVGGEALGRARPRAAFARNTRRRRAGHGDAHAAVASLRDEHADQREARRRIRELRVRGLLRHREATRR